MDDALLRFRQAADRENRRRPLRRRYSAEFQQQAVAYWQQRRVDEGVRTIAASFLPPTLRTTAAGPDCQAIVCRRIACRRQMDGTIARRGR
jgi:hypothetical protein